MKMSGGIGRRYLPWATLGCIRETILEGELKTIGCHARCKSLPHFLGGLYYE